MRLHVLSFPGKKYSFQQIVKTFNKHISVDIGILGYFPKTRRPFFRATDMTIGKITQEPRID